MSWFTVRKSCLILLAALGAAIVADIVIVSIVEYGQKPSSFTGCYAYDAMLPGFDCQGFPGEALISLWLNWPLFLIWGPLFAFESLRAFLLVLLSWAPVILFVVANIKGRVRANA